MPSKKARHFSDESLPGTEGQGQASVTAAVVNQQAPSSSSSYVHALAASLGQRVVKKEAFETVISMLYSPDKEVRMAFARLLLKVFQLISYIDGGTCFSTQCEEIYEDLLNNDLSTRPIVAFTASASAQEGPDSISNNMQIEV